MSSPSCYLLRLGIPIVKFYGLCDGKIMVRKTIFLWFLSGNVWFFRKNLGGRYLIGNN